MSAAGEETSAELPEVASPARPEPDAAPSEPEAGGAAPRAGGRLARLLLVVAVVAVEAAWLAAIAYGVWRLALLL